MLPKMNVLTFDIEEWYTEKLKRTPSNEAYKEFDNILSIILDTLERIDAKGTFFCVGALAREYPDVVKRIHSKGHEIGCHSDIHMWLTQMNEAQLFEDTRIALDSLEQVIGEKVISYRAPAFSVTHNNRWAFSVLEQCGIKNDSSVYPALRDFGGFDEFPCTLPAIIETSSGVIKEFPIPLKHIHNRQFAYSGGGYFRFFPLALIKYWIRHEQYAMTYFHIRDLMSQEVKLLDKNAYEAYFKEPGTILNRYKRYIKSNIGKQDSLNKLIKLLCDMPFISLNQANGIIDWKKAETIKL